MKSALGELLSAWNNSYFFNGNNYLVNFYECAPESCGMKELDVIDTENAEHIGSSAIL